MSAGGCHSENRLRLHPERGAKLLAIQVVFGELYDVFTSFQQPHAFIACPKCGSRDFDVLKEREYKTLGIAENLKLDDGRDIKKLARGSTYC